MRIVRIAMKRSKILGQTDQGVAIVVKSDGQTTPLEIKTMAQRNLQLGCRIGSTLLFSTNGQKFS
jgi:hypothetical protein